MHFISFFVKLNNNNNNNPTLAFLALDDISNINQMPLSTHKALIMNKYRRLRSTALFY